MTTFKDIAPGTCFVYEEFIYLKLIKNPLIFPFNCVEVESGRMWEIPDDKRIAIVKATYDEIKD